MNKEYRIFWDEKSELLLKVAYQDGKKVGMAGQTAKIWEVVELGHICIDGRYYQLVDTLDGTIVELKEVQ